MAKKVKILNLTCEGISKKGAHHCRGYDAKGKLIFEADVVVFNEVK